MPKITESISVIFHNLLSDWIYEIVMSKDTVLILLLTWPSHLGETVSLQLYLWGVIVLIILGSAYLSSKPKEKRVLPPITTPDNEQLIYLYILLYFYAAQANFFAQQRLPKASRFDINNPHHAHVKKVIDSSKGDLQTIGNWLRSQDPLILEGHQLSSLYNETINYWLTRVRSSSDVFIENASNIDE